MIAATTRAPAATQLHQDCHVTVFTNSVFDDDSYSKWRIAFCSPCCCCCSVPEARQGHGEGQAAASRDRQLRGQGKHQITRGNEVQECDLFGDAFDFEN